MKAFVPLSTAAMQLIAVMAFAQGNNVVDPSQVAEAPHGLQVAQGQTAPAASETPAPADGKASRQKRRAANSELNKAGEFSRGGSSDAPERQKPLLAPTQETTSQDRSAVRAERRAEGAEAARGPQMGEGQVAPTARETPAWADRKASGQQRRAANSELNKAGELSRGGNSDAPEKQKPLPAPRP